MWQWSDQFAVMLREPVAGRGAEWFDEVQVVKTTAWKAVAVVTDYKSCSGRRPAQWAPHQAGFKK